MGTVGDKFASNSFLVEFRETCAYPLVIQEPDPFEDEISVYITGPGTQVILTPPLATQNIEAECGDQIIEFFDA